MHLMTHSDRHSEKWSNMITSKRVIEIDNKRPEKVIEKEIKEIS
jgi:hypothetical protein